MSRAAPWKLSPLILIVLISVCCNLSGDTGSTSSAVPALELCEQIWNQAQNDIKGACGTGRHENMACYGSHLVTADIRPQEGGGLRFEEPSDIAPLSEFLQISAVVDVERHQYGVAVLDVRLKSPIGGVVTGDVVRFVLYGDTQVAPRRDVNLEFDGMHKPEDFGAFYFLTGINLTSNECRDLPVGGLVIEAPDGIQVAFEINGASVTISSTVLLEAAPNANMTVNVLEGSVKVTASGRSVTATDNEAVDVPLAPLPGTNWRAASGAPLQPRPINVSVNLQTICDIFHQADMLVPPSCAPDPTISPTPRPPSATPPPNVTATPPCVGWLQGQTFCVTNPDGVWVRPSPGAPSNRLILSNERMVVATGNEEFHDIQCWGEVQVDGITGWVEQRSFAPCKASPNPPSPTPMPPSPTLTPIIPTVTFLPTLTLTPSPVPTCEAGDLLTLVTDVTQASPGQTVVASWQTIGTGVSLNASNCGTLSGCLPGESQITVFQESNLPQSGNRAVMIPTDYPSSQLVVEMYVSGIDHPCTTTTFVLDEKKITIIP
jgi:hypothetical protein